jgi:hypothetical protein
MFLRRMPVWLSLLCACELQVTGGGGSPEPGTNVENAPAHEVDEKDQLDADAAEGAREVDAASAEEDDAATANDAHDAAGRDTASTLDAAHSDGTIDAGAGGEDAARADAASGDAASESCSLTGPFATEVLFDVTWNQTTLAGIVPLLAAGSGQIRITVRLDLGGSPDNASARLTACGARLPDFKASNALIGTEYYAAYIPDSAWDSPQMPHPAFGLAFGCTGAGCALTTDHVVATFGARTFPDDVWPGRTGALEQIVPLDQDGDGQPAITFVSRGENEKNALGMAYVNIPVTWTLGARATDADVAYRVTGVFSGKIEHCDLLSGVVSSGSVEARAVGCRTRRQGASTAAACTAEQSDFLDQNLPAWQVRGGTFRARRVAEGANCSAVRAALQ